MANILEFLRGVLIEPDAQGAFRADPAGHLERSGFGDLTGEDVVEGIAVLRRSLPAELAAALEEFEDEDYLPPVRPSNDESELDAAIRILGFAVGQVPPLGGAVQAEPATQAGAVPSWGPPPAAAEAGAPRDIDAGIDEDAEPATEEETDGLARSAIDDEADGVAASPTGHEDDDLAGSADDDAAIGSDAQTDLGAVAGASDDEADRSGDGVVGGDEAGRGSGAVGAPLAAPEAVTVDVAALPSVSAFAESLAAVATDARARSEAALQHLRVTADEQAASTKAAFDATLEEIVARSEAAARETAAGYEDLLRRAEADANGIRGDADAYAAERRREADADRDAARQYLERTRQASDDMLERNRQHAEDARQQADELLDASRAEAEAARAEIDARRAEMREAERQLKERLSGIDSLFRTVLRDDEGSAAEGGE